MLKRILWLTLWLYITLRTQQVYGGDEQERVHIKVHMSDVVHKYKHPQKVVKHHYKRPQALPIHAHRQHHPSSAKTPKTQTTIDLGYYTRGYGSGSHVPTYYPTHLPSILSETDLTNNYGPVIFDNDIMPDKQYVAIPPTFTQQQLTPRVPIKTNLLQQIFSPDIMAALTSTSGGSTAHDGASELDGDNVNILNEYFSRYATELQRLQHMEQLPQTTLRTKYQHRQQHQNHPHLQQYQPKRKKYGKKGIGEDYITAMQQLHNKSAPKQQFLPTPQQYYYNSNSNHYNQIYDAFEDSKEDPEVTSAESESAPHSYDYGAVNFEETEEDNDEQNNDFSPSLYQPTYDEYLNPIKSTLPKPFQQTKLTKFSKWKPFHPFSQLQLPKRFHTTTSPANVSYQKSKPKREPQHHHPHFEKRKNRF